MAFSGYVGGMVPKAPKKTSKNRIVRTPALYDSLVVAFRQSPGNCSHASRMTGLDRHVCARAWDKGWAHGAPGQVVLPGCGPIKLVIQAERDTVKQAAAAQAKLERELADAHLVRLRAVREAALAREAEILEDTGKGLKALAAVVQGMNAWMPAYSWEIANAVTMMGPDGKTRVPRPGHGVTMLQALKVIRDVSLVQQRVASAIDVFIKLSRLDRGASTVNVQEVELSDPNDILDELAAGATLHDRIVAGRQALVDEEGDGEEAPPVLQ